MPASSKLLHERIARHGVADRPAGSVAAAAALTCAIQAQDAPASRLGIRARAAGVTERDVLSAIATDRTVVRTWLMRATIHLVDASDVRWLVRLLGPAIIRKFRTRWHQLGLTDAVLDRSVGVLPDVLADAPLTRREIRTALADRGATIDSPDPQASTHALVHASALGLVCRGPDRGRDATFTLLEDWVPRTPAGPHGDDALAELARRYFAAFSPATTADFTTWSGLAGGRAVELIRGELAECDVDGRPGWRLGTAEPLRGVRLLPAFDNYLLGYRNRDAILGAELRGRIYQGGLIHPSVLVDGRVVGRWTLDRSRKPARVVISPFEPLPKTALRALHREAADVGRFLECEVDLTVGEPG